jgi:hypothetical protein
LVVLWVDPMVDLLGHMKVASRVACWGVSMVSHLVDVSVASMAVQ